MQQQDAKVLRFPEVPQQQSRARLTCAEVIDGYATQYGGADAYRMAALMFWRSEIGELYLDELTVEVVGDALDRFAAAPSQRFVGRNAKGEPIYRSLGPRKPATINRTKASLSAVVQWAKRKRIAPRGFINPCREVPAEHEDNRRCRYLSPAERDRLLKSARCSTWSKLYALVLMALTTGARRGELLRLRWRDIDLVAKTAALATSKNGEPRMLPLTDAMCAELKRHLRKKHLDELVFCSPHDGSRPIVFQRAWGTALREAKIERFRFHDLRHSCASYLAQQGASTLQIAEVLGHKSLDMARRYSHLNIEHKRSLVEKVLGGIE